MVHYAKKYWTLFYYWNTILQNNDNYEPHYCTIVHDGFVLHGLLHAHVKYKRKEFDTKSCHCLLNASLITLFK